MAPGSGSTPSHSDEVVKRAQKLLERKHPEVGKRAREKVLKQYTWSRAGERIERLYREMLGRAEESRADRAYSRKSASRGPFLAQGPEAEARESFYSPIAI